MALAIPGVTLYDPANEEQREESYVIYGHYNTGKSHVAASAVKHYLEDGKTCLYVVCSGEDPYMTIGQLEIGQCVAKVQSMKDYTQLMKALMRSNPKEAYKVDVIVLDSLAALSRMVTDQACGVGRYPDDPKKWRGIHDQFGIALTAWRECAPISIAVCPADRGADMFVTPDAKKPNLITPALPGQQATTLTGKVQYLGYLESSIEKDSHTVNRRIYFGPEEHCLTRANGVKRQMVEPVELVDGPSNWTRIQEAIEAHRKPVEVVEEETA